MLTDLNSGYKFDSLLIEVRDEYRVCCLECNNWVKISTPSAQIKHSRSCVSEPQIVSPEKQKPVKKNRLATVAKNHLNGLNEDSEEVFEAYLSGHLTMSQAMNSDF
jgi:hypothetical protein